MFNKEINILKALAIALVVSGHLDFSLLGDFFPPYSFQLCLFFFISGYLFKDIYLDNIPFLVAKKSKRLLLPYFAYNFVYACITVLIFNLTGRLWGQMPNLYNFFITPFLNGHQYDFSCPLWFVPQLFISLVFFAICLRALKKVINNQYFHVAIFLILASIAIGIKEYAYYPLILVCIRTLFSIFFIYLGYFYKNHLENKSIFTTKILCIVMIFQSFLWLFNKDNILHEGIGLSYILVWGQFHCSGIIPILTSITGIWFTLFITKLITPLIKDNSFISEIGKNTFHIMANHLFVFYLMTIFILTLKNIPIVELQNHYVYWIYNPEKFKFLYFIVGMISTTYIGIFINKIRIYILSRLNKPQSF